MRLVRFFFAASWKTIFTSLVEQELSENNLLSTVARLGKEWRVTVEVNPRSYQWQSYASVLPPLLHLSIYRIPVSNIKDPEPSLQYIKKPFIQHLFCKLGSGLSTTSQVR